MLFVFIMCTKPIPVATVDNDSNYLCVKFYLGTNCSLINTGDQGAPGVITEPTRIRYSVLTCC